MEINNIGIITAGGDCGGLNAVVRGAAKIAQAKGIGAFIIPHGYAGLYNLVDMGHLVRLDAPRIDRVHSSIAGSEAGHSRVKVSRIPDPGKYDRIRAGLKKFGIDGLVISGGDDTGSVMVDLADHGIPCVHAPKTMDLDLQTYSVGGDSAINKIARFLDEVKTTGQTHNRIMVVEVFGRYTGHTALRGGISADADCILIPEISPDFNIVYRHMKRNYTRRIRQSDVGSGTYTIVVAEGIRDEAGNFFSDESAGLDSFGHIKLAGAGIHVKHQLEKRMDEDPEIVEFMKEQKMFVPGLYERPEIREVAPGHLVRSGSTFAFDVNFGKEVGAAAVMLLSRGIFGVTVYQVDSDVIRYLPTREAIRRRYVDLKRVALYEQFDVCFGRENQSYIPRFEENRGRIDKFF